MNNPLRTALRCGYSSLIVGTVIFLTWFICNFFQWKPPGAKLIVMVGMFWTYIGGPLLVLIGFCFLVLGTYRWVRDSSQPRLLKESTNSFIVLSSNFVAAGFYLWIVIFISTLFSVQIINASTSSVSMVRIFGGGVDEKVGPLEPGKKRAVRFHFKHDGTLRYQIEINGGLKEGEIEGYVTNSGGGRRTLQIESNGEINVFRIPVGI